MSAPTPREHALLREIVANERLAVAQLHSKATPATVSRLADRGWLRVTGDTARLTTLGHVALAGANLADAERAVGAAVSRARRNASWAQIGDALGVTKDVAWRRHAPSSDAASRNRSTD